MPGTEVSAADVPIIAITGDVGAGKSTVSVILKEKGWLSLDADKVVAELWRRPDVIEAASARWGEAVLYKGAVVHSKVAGVIFNNRAEYDWTMRLLHPLIKEELLRRVTELKKEGRPIAAEIPMLFEAEPAAWVTFKVFVTAPRELRLQRCRERGWDEAEVSRRESFFIASEKRIAMSDFVITNGGSLDALRQAVETVISSIYSRDS